MDWLAKSPQERRQIEVKQILERAAMCRAIPLSDRGRELRATLRGALRFTDASPNRSQILAARTPRSPAAMALWLRLVREHRDERRRG